MSLSLVVVRNNTTMITMPLLLCVIYIYLIWFLKPLLRNIIP